LREHYSTFRFTDDKLQSALINAIMLSEIEFHVTHDGSIIYSGDLIERFIETIVESVFPDCYYRVEITDFFKAYRYRRFKQFKGTPYIEEMRDGITYFVQEMFEKRYRYCGIPTHVNFVLSDDNLDPDSTTAMLGICPIFACRKGEPFARPYTLRRKDSPPPASHTGWWELSSIPQVESNDVVEHLTWLLDRLNPIAFQLKRLAKEASNEAFRVIQIRSVRPQGSMQGPSLSHDMLERLSILCDRVDIWLHPDDFL